EAMLGLGIVLDDRRGTAAQQRVSERAVGLRARHMIDARLADMHRAGDACRKLQRILALIGLHRIVDRRVSSGAGFDPLVLRGADEHETAAEAEAYKAERRAAER